MYRVLLVDDEEIVLEGLQRLLSKFPEVCVVAKMHDGARAKEYLQQHRVDAVFSDIRMPVMDGMELASWICENRPDCKVVFISAYSDFGYAQQAMRYGVMSYLSKPIRQVCVNRVIEQLFHERDRIQRRDLWNRDLKRENQSKELYDSVIRGDKQQQGICLFSDYEISLDMEQCERIQLSKELLLTALTNIFSWCAPQCVCVSHGLIEDRVCCTLLGQQENDFPEGCELEERIRKLMELSTNVVRGSIADVHMLYEKEKENDSQCATDKVIVKAKAYIRENLSLNISRNDVARIVHLEPSYFSKYFKKKTGITFHDYLQNERIEKAKELLRSGYKVQDAAREAGFYNRNYFNQVFRLYTGCSPSEFKSKGDNQ